ncbi:unnamed protein product [Dibothriocephalus latus]|uniref:Uncharacterized protein n=1 Tax=Dibothriocephalus latus TaxID=60516 RepID=A0A3P7LRK7_DIBLA|nr:unnamed protein product [Dibothriocephalus latus]
MNLTSEKPKGALSEVTDILAEKLNIHEPEDPERVDPDSTAKKRKKKKKKVTKTEPEQAADEADTVPDAQIPPTTVAPTSGEGPAKKKKSKKKGSLKQTDPPSIPVGQLFPNRDFPIGEISEYKLGTDGYVV